MIDINQYNKGDYVKFLDAEELKKAFETFYNGMEDKEYFNAVMNLAGETLQIDEINKLFSGNKAIVFSKQNSRVCTKDGSRWLFKDYMFEDPYKPVINNNIPVLFGDAVYDK